MCNFITVLSFLIVSSTVLAQTAHHPMQQIKLAQQAKNPGAVIYRQTCSQCHAVDPAIPVGAPRWRKTQDWQARSQKGLKAMLKNLADGLNMMPPRGGCFECDDELLKQATLYMLPKKVQKEFAQSGKH